MNNITVFENKDFGKVRTLVIDNEPYFVGKDIAKNLGYSNTRDALNRHVEVEDKKDGVVIHDSIGREQTPTVINESGLYSLILSSKLPQAKKFKRWVTSEVLPSIRKTGAYISTNMPSEKIEEILLNPDFIIKLANQLKEEIEKNKKLEKKIEEDKPLVDFTKSVAASKDSILVGQLAMILKQNGVDIGQNRLFKWLRENGYLVKAKTRNYNLPTQRSLNQGLIEIEQATIFKAGMREPRVTATPMVTVKGQIYFINKFLKDKNKNILLEDKSEKHKLLNDELNYSIFSLN